MKLHKLICMAIIAMTTVSCGEKKTESAVGMEVPAEITIKDKTLKMNDVQGGTFSMGWNNSGRKVKNSAVHQVVLNGFSISSIVSNGLWKTVMGSYPGNVTTPEAPAVFVTWEECMKFIGKLSKMTGIPFSLPTEAQWEYAYRAGIIQANAALGEWCSDRYEDSYGSGLMTNPEGPDVDTYLQVVRTPGERRGLSKYNGDPNVGFRVVVNTSTPIPESVMSMLSGRDEGREHVSKNETIKVGSVSFQMVGVEGGTFFMGATPEQERMTGDRRYKIGEDEKPVHQVTLSGFEIGQTEVTAGLWKEVMGIMPFGNDNPDKPVVNVSWYDCRQFIAKLNEMTGRKFRLPTEAEWEYAARGGKRSAGYKFSGGRFLYEVGVYATDKPKSVAKIKSLRPNELGIYDMSGNAWEWCEDSPSTYSESAQKDPCVRSDKVERIMRGGSAASPLDACRVSNRSNVPAYVVKSTFGFRLAL